jgi:hypothetical protein
MKKITTQECKEAIVEWVKTHRGHVSTLFGGQNGYVTDNNCNMISYDDFEVLPSNPKNWKRIIKRKPNNIESKQGITCVREFDCLPFDDQLRAIITSDEQRIISVIIEGQ